MHLQGAHPAPSSHKQQACLTQLCARDFPHARYSDDYSIAVLSLWPHGILFYTSVYHVLPCIRHTFGPHF